MVRDSFINKQQKLSTLLVVSELSNIFHFMMPPDVKIEEPLQHLVESYIILLSKRSIAGRT